MKILPLFGVLCAASLCFAGDAAFAQQAPATKAAPARSGADLLLEARQMFVYEAPDRNLPAPSDAEGAGMVAARVSLERNAKALDKLRAAIDLGVAMPPIYDAKLSNALTFIPMLLAQEAAVRAADGDNVAAMRSTLDMFKLATQVGSGRNGLLNASSAQSLAKDARLTLERIAPQLDAIQLREVAAQWEELDAQMPVYAEQLPAEEKSVLREMALASMEWLRDPKARATLLASLDNPKLPPTTVATFRGFLSIPFDELEPEVHRVFAAATRSVDLPYQKVVQTLPLKGVNNYIAGHVQNALDPLARFSFERSTTNNRLFVAALRLHADKLDDGVYPATFDAGADSFSPTLAPLVYRREGNSYLLYSVGPDGIDEGGAEMQTLFTSPETGQKSVNGNVMPDSRGDIVAPVL